MLVFHSALASYRVDQFNLLNELFELEVVFLLDNLLYFKFDQDSLKNQCKFKISYLLKGPKIGIRYFRFGVLRKIREMKPDIVLSKYKIAIQINGCFWHGHSNCKYFVLPKTRTKWWKEKIEKKVQGLRLEV